MFFAFSDHNFGCRIYFTAIQQVSANGFTGAVRQRNMQVRSIHRYGSHQAHDLKMTFIAITFFLVGKTDLVLCQTTHRCGYPASSYLVLLYV